MSTSVIDSLLYKDQFGTPEMRKIFSDRTMVQNWLDVEASLAKVQSELDIIPVEAAKEIEKNADVDLINFEELKSEIDKTNHPFVPVITLLKKLCNDDYGEYIHWGATTQDIMDSGLILQIKSAHETILKNAHELHDLINTLAIKYKDVSVIGRTNGQHALPITLGFKFAVWSHELERSISRLVECEDRLFTGQFSGAVGTLASLENDGLTIQRLLLEELKLNVPKITWHSSRDSLVEFASILAILAGSIGSIAKELYNLNKTETDEFYLRQTEDEISSSTMPHKKSPFNLMHVIYISRIIKANIHEAYLTLESESERDVRVLSIEQDYISRICCMTDASIVKLHSTLEKFETIKKNIDKNLHLLGDLISSEKFMLKLAEKVGRQTAHNIVHEASMKSREENNSLKKQVILYKEVNYNFNFNQLEDLLNPQNYIGLSQWFVE